MKNYKTIETVDALLANGNDVTLAWSEYQEGLQHKVWLGALNADYDSDFLLTKDETHAEYKAGLSDGETAVTKTAYNKVGFVKKQITIDYSNDGSYLTFDEYKNERKVITVDAVTDETTGDEITPATTRQGDLVRGFLVDVDSFELLSEHQPYIAYQSHKINKDFELSIESITSKYSSLEISMWPEQAREARAFVADNSVATPMLSGIAARLGVGVSVIANKVIEKADIYSALSGDMLGLKQKKQLEASV